MCAQLTLVLALPSQRIHNEMRSRLEALLPQVSRELFPSGSLERGFVDFNKQGMLVIWGNDSVGGKVAWSPISGELYEILRATLTFHAKEIVRLVQVHNDRQRELYRACATEEQAPAPMDWLNTELDDSV